MDKGHTECGSSSKCTVYQLDSLPGRVPCVPQSSASCFTEKDFYSECKKLKLVLWLAYVCVLDNKRFTKYS